MCNENIKVNKITTCLYGRVVYVCVKERYFLLRTLKRNHLYKIRYETFNNLKMGNIYKLLIQLEKDKREYHLIKPMGCYHFNKRDYSQEFKRLDIIRKKPLNLDKNIIKSDTKSDNFIMGILNKTDNDFNKCYAKHIKNN